MNIAVQIAIGALLGFLSATTWESCAHDCILHAPARRRALWRRHRWLFASFLRAFHRHSVIHHGRTFRRDFVTQFGDDAEKAALDAELVGPYGDFVRRERYGLTIRGASFALFLGPVPAFLALIWMVFGPWAAAAASPILSVPAALSALLHPYLHMPHAKAMEAAGPLMRCFLRTRYARAVVRHHYLHHRRPTCNFNLLLGGDWLLGAARPPDTVDLQAMRRQGLR